jgi:hypothetical protein
VKVRTDFFEKIAFLFGISFGEQFCPVFSLQNEPNGRFEPIASVLVERLQFASEFGLPVHEEVLLLYVFGFAHLLRQAQVEEKVDLPLAGRDCGLGGCGGSLLGLR